VLFVDGARAGAVSERLQPERFVLGGGGRAAGEAPQQADFTEWMIHRAGLNADEAAALYAGTLVQASLEVYASLSGSSATATENRAQSLSVVEIERAGVTHTEE
jgi:hypothetical protein